VNGLELSGLEIGSSPCGCQGAGGGREPAVKSYLVLVKSEESVIRVFPNNFQPTSFNERQLRSPET